MKNKHITIANGDGIYPNIINSSLCVLRDSGANVHFDFVEVGLRAFHHGFENGVPNSCMETILRNKIFLKSPTIDKNNKHHRLESLNEENIFEYNIDLSEIETEFSPLGCKITYNQHLAIFEPQLDNKFDIGFCNNSKVVDILLAFSLMLSYVGDYEASDKIANSVLHTIEQNDFDDENANNGSSIDNFCQRIIDNLSCRPSFLEIFKSKEIACKIMRPFNKVDLISVNE